MDQEPRLDRGSTQAEEKHRATLAQAASIMLTNLPSVRGKILEKNTYFTKRLIDAFDSADYHTNVNKSFGWVRSLGEDIANEGSTLITVAHLGAVTKNMHWVPLIIRKGEILYGDSFWNRNARQT